MEYEGGKRRKEGRKEGRKKSRRDMFEEKE